MASGLPKVKFHLADAQSAITAARTLLKEQLHEDDRKPIEELLTRAEDKLDSADAVLGNIRARLDGISDQL